MLHRQDLLIALTALPLLWIVGAAPQLIGGYDYMTQTKRMNAEIPGLEDSGNSVQENEVESSMGSFLWKGVFGGHHKKKKPQKRHYHKHTKDYHKDPYAYGKDDGEPWYYPERDPWQDLSDEYYSSSDNPEPWYYSHEHDPWDEEPCIPVYPESKRPNAYESGLHSYHSKEESKEDKKSSDEYDWMQEEWNKQSYYYDKGKLWKDEYTKEHKIPYKTSKSKERKGAKGHKGHKGKPHKLKPCPAKYPVKTPTKYPVKTPTKYPAKEPTKAPTKESKFASPDEDPKPYHRSSEAMVSLSPFVIQYKVWELRFPTSNEIYDIIGETMYYLEEFFLGAFANGDTKLNFLTVESPKDAHLVPDNILKVFFTAEAYFDTGRVVPSVDELDVLVRNAFSDNESLKDYHEQLKALQDSSIFYSATVFSTSTISVYDLDEDEEMDNGVQTRPQDSVFEDHAPLETAMHDPKGNDAIPYDSGNVDTVPSTPLPVGTPALSDPKDTASSSSNFSPPLMVVAVISGTIVTMGGLLMYLYRQKERKLKEQEKQKNEQLFPPPTKEDVKSIAEETMILEDEDGLVECEIGDDDFSSQGSSSRRSRRSRAENFLRLVQDDDASSTGSSSNGGSSSTPRRFLVANASRRRGNTWTQ